MCQSYKCPEFNNPNQFVIILNSKYYNSFLNSHVIFSQSKYTKSLSFLLGPSCNYINQNKLNLGCLYQKTE